MGGEAVAWQYWGRNCREPKGLGRCRDKRRYRALVKRRLRTLRGAGEKKGFPDRESNPGRGGESAES